MDLLDFDRGGGFVGTFGEIETRKKLEEGMTLLPPFLVCVWKGGTFGVPYVRTVRARYSSSVCGSACRTTKLQYGVIIIWRIMDGHDFLLSAFRAKSLEKYVGVHTHDRAL